MNLTPLIWTSNNMMHKSAKIFIAGHKGLVGSAITRHLLHEGFNNLISRNREQLDLLNQSQVDQFFATEKPEYVFLAAAKVGGIHANNVYRGEFIYNNLTIQTNVIEAARKHGVERLLFLGSSCIYPRNCPQPMKEEHLLTSPLEQTNEPYAIAKIAGIKMCAAYNDQYGTNFASVMPTNLYGPHDNFNLETSHVLPALVRKVHEAKLKKAKEVVVWGSGTPKREFLYVDDMAAGCIFVMNQTDFKDMVNLGSGDEVTIRELVELVCEVVGFDGELTFDASKPDGTPRKLLDVSRLNKLGWSAQVKLKEGLGKTYEWFVENAI